MTTYHISVYNLAMPKDTFDSLCDMLSKLRKYCIDYRLISDFDGSKEQPYWNSNSYTANEQMLINATYESVKTDVEKFCILHGLDIRQVDIKITDCEI